MNQLIGSVIDFGTLKSLEYDENKSQVVSLPGQGTHAWLRIMTTRHIQA